MSRLLDEIAALGDDAFIGWERVVEAVPGVLEPTPSPPRPWTTAEDNEPRLEDDNLLAFDDYPATYVVSGCRYVAVWIQGRWFTRNPGENLNEFDRRVLRELG